MTLKTGGLNPPTPPHITHTGPHNTPYTLHTYSNWGVPPNQTIPTPDDSTHAQYAWAATWPVPPATEPSVAGDPTNYPHIDCSSALYTICHMTSVRIKWYLTLWLPALVARQVAETTSEWKTVPEVQS